MSILMFGQQSGPKRINNYMNKDEILEYRKTHTKKDTRLKYGISNDTIRRWEDPEFAKKERERQRLRNKNRTDKQRDAANAGDRRRYVPRQNLPKEVREHLRAKYRARYEKTKATHNQKVRQRINESTDPVTKIRFSSEYEQWRFSIYERDGYKCQDCGRSRCKLYAHHIKFPLREHMDIALDINNGITLCKSCHNNKHKS